MSTHAARAARTTADEDARTVEMLFSTGAAVTRGGYGPDGKANGRWVEKLSIGGADLSRLQGAPLVTDHEVTVANIVGTVETSRRERSGLAAVVRFGRGIRAEALFQDVTDGIIRNVSVGYRVLRWAFLGDDDTGTRVYEATSWEPLEISLVAVPADPAARIRSTTEDTATPTNPNMLRREAEIMTLYSPQADPASTDNRTAPPAPVAPVAPVEDLSARAVEAERQRIRDIYRLAERSNLTGRAASQEVDRLVAEGADLPTARAAIMDLAVQTAPRIQGRGDPIGAPVDGNAALVSAVAHRLNPAVPLAPGGEVYARMGMREIAELADRNTGRGDYLSSRSTPGMLTTSDFVSLLSQSTELAVAQTFNATPPALLAAARRLTAADLQSFAVLRPTTAPALLAVNEHGEIKSAPLDASFETMSVQTFARIVNLSRHLILADRLEVLTDFIGMAARSANNTLGSVLYTALTGNPNMQDGTPFYHANRANRAATGSALDAANLEAAIVALRSQTDAEGPVNVVPALLVVGPRQEAAARRLVANVAATEAGQVNPFTYLSVVVEPRIVNNSWYVLASPAVTAALAYAVLDGSRRMSTNGAPAVDFKEGWEVLGLSVRTVFDAGAAPIEPRAAFYNPGV